MSAAATAAGYLYASGRLRGRGAKEQQEEAKPQERKKPAQPQRGERREVRVAVYEPPREAPAEKPKRVPKIQYRTRRWRPGTGGDSPAGGGK